MTPTLFILQLAVLFLPGVIWAHLDNKYASRKDDGQLWFLLRAMMFGISSHSVTWFIYWAVSQEYVIPNLVIADKQTVITDRIGWQILWATVTGFVLAIVWMYFINYKVLTRLLQRIGATKTYGDEDVWNFVLNSSDASSRYVNVRDFENKITYSGFVHAFSESERLRELILVDADVYNFEGAFMFEAPRIYLARSPEGIHMEFPTQPQQLAEEEE